jgi:hypothetical protein
MQTSGYSGTPLAKKLGIQQGFKIRLINAPDHYFTLFTDFPEDILMSKDVKIKKNFIHCFVTREKELHKNIVSIRKEIERNGIIWISWPKKASKVTTDVTEDTVRNIALANGLVDIKVCAVDEIWSGLKLVIPLKDR